MASGVDILIEELDGSLWVATMEKNRLVGLEVDPVHEEVRWGSIYWGRVFRIDAALDAVFVDLDGQNKGILNNADVYLQEPDGKIRRGGDVAIGKILQAGQMIAVQAKSGYVPKQDDEMFPHSEEKIPRLTMNIALPGRYLIHTPLGRENRVSSRIRNKQMRDQLKTMLDSFHEMHGYILRAAAADTQTVILTREAEILRAIWEQVQEHFTGVEPTLLMLGPDSVQRTLSDQSIGRINRIEVATMDHYQYAEEWCEIFAPDLVTKIQAVELENGEEDMALFDERDIMGQIEDLFQPYMVLENGGSVIIEKTAALTAIDVNRGGDKRSNLAINVEAAIEIARQIRIRNLGGMILIDFIRLKSKDEQDALRRAMEDAIGTDPCTVQIHGFSPMGLMEITRSRRTPPLHDRFYTKFD